MKGRMIYCMCRMTQACLVTDILFVLKTEDRTVVSKWRKVGKMRSRVSTTQARMEHCEAAPETGDSWIGCLG